MSNASQAPVHGGRRARQGQSKPSSLEQLLASREIVIACGSGGVGKTTTAAAAAAMAAVKQGGKVLVLTVDPAKRLANALGLEGFGNTAVRVPPEAFKAAGVSPRGELWAAMLDTKQSWDNLVARHAPDPLTAQRILANPLYQNITGRFIQSHEYIAMERLYELHGDGEYDLIVVDTPPTRNAIDFLEAPQRMAEFFSSRFLRLLTVPYRSRVMNFATRPFYQVADRVLGTQFLQDIAEFFMLFQTMGPGFVTRAQAVTRLLHDRRTTFIVVSTLEAAPAHEAEFFIDVLASKKFHLGAIVLNKVLPSYLRDEAATVTAERMCDQAPAISGALAPSLAAASDGGGGGEGSGRSAGQTVATGPDDTGPAPDPDIDDSFVEQVQRVLAEIAGSFLRFQVVAQREADQQAALGRIPDVVATVPYFETDIYDLAGLLRLGEQIWC